MEDILEYTSGVLEEDPIVAAMTASAGRTAHNIVP